MWLKAWIHLLFVVARSNFGATTWAFFSTFRLPPPPLKLACFLGLPDHSSDPGSDELRHLNPAEGCDFPQIGVKRGAQLHVYLVCILLQSVYLLSFVVAQYPLVSQRAYKDMLQYT